jgi:transposase
MIQITPQMRVLVAVEPVDFRRGIDGIARVCRDLLRSDPFCGTAYVFRNRRGTAIKILLYDGQGFWLCHKRLSAGRFWCWPSADGNAATSLQSHELQVLLFGGDPTATKASPVWRSVSPSVETSPVDG